MGVGFGLAVVVGGTIGAGILRTPGMVAAQVRSPWLVMAGWLLGGVFAFFCTACVTELATMLPQEGGWYVYSGKAFGEYAGFLVGCCDWMMQVTAISYLAVAFGEFLAGLQPTLALHIKLMAIAAVLILTFLNWLGLKSGSRAQELTSLVKTFALIAFVAACFLLAPRSGAPEASEPINFPASRGNILLALVVALQGVIVTYDGWYSAIYFMEEDRNPSKNLPRSAMGGIIACIAVFLLVNAALLHVLPMARLAASPVPAADAAMMVLGSHGRQIVLMLSLVTVVSTINALLLIAPRILFAMGRDGLLPRRMASVNSGGTPAAALWMGALVIVVLILTGSFETLIAIASFMFVAVYISGFSALFRLRVRAPEIARPFKMWGYPWTTAGVLLASAAFLIASVISDIKHSVLTLGLIAVSYPVYWFAIKKKTADSAAENSELRHDEA